MQKNNTWHSWANAVIRLAAAATLLAGLVACGERANVGEGAPSHSPSPSAGQVAAPAAPAVSFYAASRFAEQASFGPTPALVAEIQAKGFERWIDEQMALPFVPVDMATAEEIYAYPQNAQNIPDRVGRHAQIAMTRKALAAPDQLRWRVMWSLSQFIVAGATKGEPPGWVTWMNLLARHAFGRYGELLRDTSLDRHMGHYLDNDQNRPKSAECPHCAPNENYARELMQLFSIGVFKLNADGTPQRDARGRFIETYSQKDVEELARALTGWTTDPNPQNRPQRNWGNWGKPMVPSTWPPERDDGRKVVMGTVFPAGQGAPKDLDTTVAMLMNHPNIAPFVSLRLIQHLVKSDPSPAYIARVGAKFRDNGTGQAGDLKAVLKAILLDPEARRGDNQATANNQDGKFREPYLHRIGAFRGLGCRDNPVRGDGFYWTSWLQDPLRPESVFSFYAPTDRAPGSNLLAPEQRLVNSNEFTTRLNELNGLRWNNASKSNDLSALTNAGCNVDEFVRAYASSPRAFMDLLSLRFFRGAMPPTLRSTLEQLIRSSRWNNADPTEGPLRMMDYALTTPSYGVIK